MHSIAWQQNLWYDAKVEHEAGQLFMAVAMCFYRNVYEQK